MKLQAPKPLTRAQKLARARAQKLARAIVKCEKLKHPKQRMACVRAARKRYSPPKPKKHKKSTK